MSTPRTRGSGSQDRSARRKDRSPRTRIGVRPYWPPHRRGGLATPNVSWKISNSRSLPRHERLARVVRDRRGAPRRPAPPPAGERTLLDPVQPVGRTVQSSSVNAKIRTSGGQPEVQRSRLPRVPVGMWMTRLSCGTGEAGSLWSTTITSNESWSQASTLAKHRAQVLRPVPGGDDHRDPGRVNRRVRCERRIRPSPSPPVLVGTAHRADRRPPCCRTPCIGAIPLGGLRQGTLVTGGMSPPPLTVPFRDGPLRPLRDGRDDDDWEAGVVLQRSPEPKGGIYAKAAADGRAVAPTLHGQEHEVPPTRGAASCRPV